MPDLVTPFWAERPERVREKQATHSVTATLPSGLAVAGAVLAKALPSSGGLGIFPIFRDGSEEFTVWEANGDYSHLSSATNLMLTEARQRRKRGKKAEQRMLEAEKRARRLLIRSLSRKQRSQLLLSGLRSFFVLGESGDLYKIFREEGVERYRRNGILTMYCLHPDTWMPWGDVMLAQKLMIEHEESEFERRANDCGSVRWHWKEKAHRFEDFVAHS